MQELQDFSRVTHCRKLAALVALLMYTIRVSWVREKPSLVASSKAAQRSFPVVRKHIANSVHVNLCFLMNYLDLMYSFPDF